MLGVEARGPMGRVHGKEQESGLEFEHLQAVVVIQEQALRQRGVELENDAVSRAEGVTQMVDRVECLPSMCETLGSVPSTEKTEEWGKN
jgi:hypothetical protein